MLYYMLSGKKKYEQFRTTRDCGHRPRPARRVAWNGAARRSIPPLRLDPPSQYPALGARLRCARRNLRRYRKRAEPGRPDADRVADPRNPALSETICACVASRDGRDRSRQREILCDGSGGGASGSARRAFRRQSSDGRNREVGAGVGVPGALRQCGCVRVPVPGFPGFRRGAG